MAFLAHELRIQSNVSGDLVKRSDDLCGVHPAFGGLEKGLLAFLNKDQYIQTFGLETLQFQLNQYYIFAIS